MRKLIPYAGFEERPSLRGMTRVPAKRADELRRTGLTWREVAQILTDESDREMPYTVDAVLAAVTKLRKAGKDEQRNA